MTFLGVNFHYIGDEDRYENGIYPISLERFSGQLDILAENFQFISQKDLLDAIEEKKELPEMSCLVTFDDGLKCQFEKALPILQKKNIPAVFFVCSLPYLEKKACFIHKIHWLRAHLSPEIFRELVEEKVKEILGKDMGFYLTKDNIEKASARYRYDSSKEAGLKFILNMILNISEKEKIIDSIFSSQISDERDFAEKIYLSENQIKELHDLGFLGMHTYDHRPLSRLKDDELKKNLAGNKNHLESLVNGKIFSVSYPHGSKIEVSDKAVEICRELGLKLGFTMERAFNTSLRNPLLFARADINDAVGGKYPLFRIENGNIEITGKFGKKREMFCEDE